MKVLLRLWPYQTVVLVSSSEAATVLQPASGRAVPALYRLDQGLLIIIPATSTYYLQIKGGQVQMLSGSLSEQMADQLQQAQPVAMQPDDRARTILDSPMQPMTPLRMNKNPMSMSMGDMKMTVGETGLGEISPGDMKLNTQPDPTESRLSTSSASSHSQGEAGSAKVRRFCSQCGSAVALGDRFCACCGTQLN